MFAQRPSESEGESSAPRLRVAFVNTHPIQYFAPLYTYLGRESAIDVTALYLSDLSLRGGIDAGFDRAVTWDIDLLSGYDAQFLGEAATRRQIGGFFSMVGPELWPAIRGGAFDGLIIHGHNLAAHFLALAAAKSSGTPVFLRGETHPGLKRPPLKSALRSALVRPLVHRFDGCLAIGSANARYYQSIGVPAERIFHVPYTIDNDRFARQATLNPTERNGLIASLGLDANRPVILFAGKFDVRKRPGDLICAFARLRRLGTDAQLAMVGAGVLEPDLRRLAEQEGIGDIVFPGFRNQSELPALYGACDVFVLPSENEPWGLAVNEAMAAGAPVVLSREIGCAEDLVQDGVNGRVFEARDIDGLAEALRDVVSDPSRSRAMGAASRARIAEWSYRECGVGIRAAIKAVGKS